MKNFMYSIYDKKTQVFTPPFSAINQGDAIRTVTSMLMRDNLQIAQFPDDYELYEVGSFSDSTGALVGKHPEKYFVCQIRTLLDEIQQKREKDQLRLFDNKNIQKTGKKAQTNDKKANDNIFKKAP